MQEYAGLVATILALINVSLIGGIFLGRLSASCKAAHHRLDDLEEKLCSRLENTLREAWRFCPLAGKGPHDGGGSL